jgi:hypothetical protein
MNGAGNPIVHASRRVTPPRRTVGGWRPKNRGCYCIQPVARPSNEPRPPGRPVRRGDPSAGATCYCIWIDARNERTSIGSPVRKDSMTANVATVLSTQSSKDNSSMLSDLDTARLKAATSAL